LIEGGLWLERANPEDVEALAVLEEACHSHPWTLDQVRQEVGYGPPGAVLVLRGLRPRGQIRAFCVYRFVAGEMHILDVAVAPAVRRRGLARWLLTVSMKMSSRAGARRALLEVRESNTEARALYQGLGFELLGRRRDYYTQPREDGLVLASDLLPWGVS
jgi:ribosomal-protein-alanine N-acetyltransferase